MVPLRVVNRAPSIFAFRPRVVRMGSQRLFPQHDLGRRKELGSIFDNLGENILIGAGGVAALMVSGILPSPVDGLLKAGGVFAIGYALYKTFSGESNPNPKVPKVEQKSKGNLDLVDVSFQEPQENTTVSIGPVGRTLTVRYRVTNRGPSEVEVPMQLFFSFVKDTGEAVPKEYSLPSVTVPAGSSVSDSYTVDMDLSTIGVVVAGATLSLSAPETSRAVAHVNFKIDQSW